MVLSASPTYDRLAVIQWLETCCQEQPGTPSAASPQPQLSTPPSSTPSTQQQRERGRPAPTSTVQQERTQDMSESRSGSPSKRQRTSREDEVSSVPSAPNFAITELSDRTRLSQPSLYSRSGSKRAPSPVRGLLNSLRLSKPAIQCEIPSTLTLPPHASALQHCLMERLEEAIIPLGLKDRILTTYPFVAASIPMSSYDASDAMTASELDAVWECIEEILAESKDCGRYQQDENAWCIKVVHPLLRLALKGGSRLKVESVQTHTINPDLLPVTPQNYRVQRKADFTFSFHRNVPEASDLYNHVELAGIGEQISHTIDANTSRLALFSGIEVKPENGGKDEALIQLAIWLAAGLESVRRLGDSGRKRPYTVENLKPTVGWTVIGHDWHTYIAYMASEDGRDVFKVIGPWRVAAADTRDIFGVFKLLRLVRNATAFASNVYWAWLRDEILTPHTTLEA